MVAERRALLRRLAVAALLIAAAAGPVALYDRLVARHLLERRQAPPVLSPQMIIDAFHQLSYYDSRTWLLNTWLGIPTRQNPNDVWITQEIISETKPDVVVETGTFHGGSAVLWAMVLGQVKPAGRVISIDIEDMVDEATLPPVAREKVTFLVGSSTAPEIVAEVRRRVGGKRVLVVLDSDHSMKHVLAELDAYAPLVQVGDYLIVQDTNLNGHPVHPGSGPGPMEAVDQFLQRDSRFESDRSRERLLFTMHPKGYLRRVRS